MKIIIKNIYDYLQWKEISSFIETQFTTDKENSSCEIKFLGDYGDYIFKVKVKNREIEKIEIERVIK